MQHAFPRFLVVILAVTSGSLVCCAAVPDRLVHRINDLTEPAQKGDGPSQLKLGIAYDESGDSKMAVHWYKRAAEKGYIEAAARLGVKYFIGDGTAKNAAEAVKWFRRAGERGDATSQFNLASCYIAGDGVGKNFAQAIRWSRVAANNGYPDAEYMMGVLYGRGDGVPQDYVKSFEWISKAAVHGHPRAQKSLEALKGVMTAKQMALAKEHIEAPKLKNSTQN